MDALFTNGFVITAGGLRFVQHEGATRNENVPAVDLLWNDLAPPLLPDKRIPGAGYVTFRAITFYRHRQRTFE
jgi:hypothetical protein